MAEDVSRVGTLIDVSGKFERREDGVGLIATVPFFQNGYRHLVRQLGEELTELLDGATFGGLHDASRMTAFYRKSSLLGETLSERLGDVDEHRTESDSLVGRELVNVMG